jgi:O-antigen/teichoic acid export membrane protein
MGMSIAIANALTSIALAWMNTKAPQFGALVAKKDFTTMDRLFRFALSRSLTVMVLLGIGLCTLNFILHAESNQFAVRLLDPAIFTLLIAATCCVYVTNAQSIYLRANKEEPFMYLNVASAALTSASTFFLGKLFGASGMIAGYLAISVFVGLAGGSAIFYAKRRTYRDGYPGPR